MTRLTVTDLPLAGLKLVERNLIGDDRGYLCRLFCKEELEACGWKKPVAQINHTYTSKKGTIRGLHYQIQPWTEMKLVNCIRGEVWDVAVDLRSNSPTCMHWHAQILSENNRRALLLPEGFAHGFQSLTDDVELIYLHSEVYYPNAEAALRFDDKILDIKWPLAITAISERDKAHSLLTTKFKGITLI